MSTIERAIAIAAQAHDRQVDQAGFPYILHPLRVALAMRSCDGQIVGALHDVAEDIPDWPLERISAEGFSVEVVCALSQLHRPRDVSYAGYMAEFVRHGSALARAVKAADLRDNLAPERLGRLLPSRAESLARRYVPWLGRLVDSSDIVGF